MDDIEIEIGNDFVAKEKKESGSENFDIPDNIEEPAFDPSQEFSALDMLEEYKKSEEETNEEATSKFPEKEKESSSSSEESGEEKKEVEIEIEEKIVEEEEEEDGEVDWGKVNIQTTENAKVDERIESISYEDCLKYFYSRFKDIKIEENDDIQFGFFERIFRTLFCIGLPQNLPNELRSEKGKLSEILKISLDFDDEIHKSMMFSMYKSIKKEDKNPAVIGPHWVDLGFQRNDPKTDLRGSGIYGIIQILYFLRMNENLVIEIYRSSKIENNPFPFACVSLNWTSSSLRLLNNGKLDGLIREKGSVADALNIAYMAMFLEFHRKWRSESWTIREYGEGKKKITEYAMKNIQTLIKKFEKYCQENKD